MSKTPKEKKPASGERTWETEAGFSPTASEAPEVVEYQRPQRRNINQLVGQVITITSYRLSESARFRAPIAYIKIVDSSGKEEEVYTFSRVIIRQLQEEIDQLLKSGKAVKAKVVKQKNYIALAPPGG